MTDDTKKHLISALAGLAGVLGGSAGTYKVMEYRLGLAEQAVAGLDGKIEKLNGKIDALDDKIEQEGQDVTCLIYEVHNTQIRPGC